MKTRNISISMVALLETFSVQAISQPSIFAETNNFGTNIYVNNHLVSTPKHVISSDSGNKTAFIPLYYLQQALRGFGIDSSWEGNTGALNLANPQDRTVDLMNLPRNQPIASTKMHITISDSTVEYAPRQVAPDPASGKLTTYVPIYYLEQALNRLGFSSTWDGTNWNIKDILSSKPGAINLTLQNDTSIASRLPQPPVPPVAPVTLTLPIYPGAVSSNQKFTSFGDIPVESYVQDGKAEYIAPNALTAVEAWYMNAFTEAGYIQNGSANGTGFDSAVFFTPKTQPNNQQIEVEISFKTISAEQTLLEFWITDIAIPPRPSSSYIPSDIQSVDISITTSNSTNEGLQKATITNSTTIDNLVQTVNSLTTIMPNGETASPMISSQTKSQVATLIFHEKNGGTMTATDTNYNDTSFVQISNIPLKDPQNVVWDSILSAMGANSSTQ